MSQSAKSLYDQACKKYFPFRGEPKYEETLALCQEICDNFPASPESELAKIRIGQIRVIKPNLFPDDVADSSSLKQTTDDKAEATTKADSSYMTGKYDKSFKILGITLSSLCDLDKKYDELKTKWHLDNFISNPDMYQRAVNVNADIDEAFNVLNTERADLNRIYTDNPQHHTKVSRSDCHEDTVECISNDAIGADDVLKIIYIFLSFLMFCFFMYHGIQEHGQLFAICLFPWYMFKGVLWPIFLIFHLY